MIFGERRAALNGSLRRCVGSLLRRLRTAMRRGDTQRLMRSALDLGECAPEKAAQWQARIGDVLACPDNAHIPRADAAGQVVEGALIMHNGLKVSPLGYCGRPMLKMLSINRGVHEPQEERVFQEVLKTLPAASTMLELGSYWAFYSMWFLASVASARCYLVEPEPNCLEIGKKNFALNGMDGDFTRAKIGACSVAGGDCHTTCIDDYVREKQIGFVDVLHADIQGKELEMLEGARCLLSEQRVGYVFISTHSNGLHDACRAALNCHGFVEIASANIDETYSYDGILVMRSVEYGNLAPVPISRRDGANPMFPRIRC